MIIPCKDWLQECGRSKLPSSFIYRQQKAHWQPKVREGEEKKKKKKLYMAVKAAPKSRVTSR